MVVRRMNRRMERLLPTLMPRPVPEEVEAALRSGIAEWGPLLLLRCEAERLTAPRVDNLLRALQDATGVEAFLNHVHPDQTGWEPEQCAEAAMTALDILREQIIGYALSGPVQVVLSVGFHEIPSSSLRFYRRRPGEPWLDENLDADADEGLLIEDIR